MARAIGKVVGLDALLAMDPASTLVLTVNNRLSRSVSARFARQRESGATELATIVPWRAWLTQTAFSLSFDRSQVDIPDHVLDPPVARMLWREIIARRQAQDGLRGLIDVDQLASLAVQADELMLDWRVHVDPAWVTPEYGQFMQWQSAYESRLRQLGAIDRTRLVLNVRDWIEHGRIHVPAKVVMAGFAQYSPAMHDILDAMRRQGSAVYELTLDKPVRHHEPRAVQLADSKQEWQQAIAWSRASLEANPKGRFAIIVPDLQAQADHARRMLHAALWPDHRYNVAVAPALAEWPQALALFAWLGLTGGLKVHAQVPVHSAGRAMLAGMCAGDLKERGQRAAIDAGWRESGLLSVTLDAWRRGLEELPELGLAWQEMFTCWEGVDGHLKQSWFAWVALFRRSMRALGFPGDQTRTSTGFQAIAALDTLFEKVAVFDDFFDQVNWSEALARLESVARQTLFQPQRDADARLDVLGMLESEGGRWDGVWVLGLTDRVMPAAISPNPLLPRQALSQAQAPRSTPAGEQQWADRMFETLCDLAPSVTMSWPMRDDQQVLRPSPLLAQLSCSPDERPGTEAQEPSGVPAALPLETWVDGPTPALLPDEWVRGGVAILDIQSKNPMWAFLRHRLKTRALKPYAVAPSPSQRGIFLHAVMRAVWERLDDLRALKEQRLTPAFEQWLEATVTSLARLSMPDWPPALVDLEKSRAIELVNQWLGLEAGRQPFAVQEKESVYHLRFRLLEIKVVIDRIDQVIDPQALAEISGATDGMAGPPLLLLDYKTGTSLPDPRTHWDRPYGLPVEVQMLAYVRAIRQTTGQWPSGIAWGQLNPRKVKFAGVLREGVALPGVSDSSVLSEDDWLRRLQTWDQGLERLAEEFEAGQAHNLSWQRADLKYCDIRHLLRLHEESSDE